jgi:hypothetical protein
VFAGRQGDAGFVERGDASPEPGLYAELAQRFLDHWARAFAHVGSDRTVAVDDDHARLGVLAKDFAQARGQLGCCLDAGEAAAGDDDRIAPVDGRPVGQAV